MGKSIVIDGITVSSITVNQEVGGLYCLNDLHRAAGNEKRHQPGNWLNTQQTQELIAALKEDGKPITEIVLVINGGDFKGSYGCRELVYAYAMWISPKLCVAAIRTMMKENSRHEGVGAAVG